IPSPMSGRVEKIHVHPGETVSVGAPLISFADADGGGRAPMAAPAAAVSAAAPTPRTQSPPARDGGPVPATPATRRLARELGVDLRQVRGTGAAGRVTDADVHAAASRDITQPASDSREVSPAASVPRSSPSARAEATRQASSAGEPAGQPLESAPLA